MFSNALLTDFYELTMAAGYLEHGKASDTAAFDLYFRQNPFNGGYSIAAGLEPAVRAVVDCRFHKDDIRFLKEQKSPNGTPVFRDQFLDYLVSFRFRGNIKAIPEGTVVFPNEPLLQVRGNLIECQILESILLCHVNFQTLVATKAARIWEASNHGTVIEFGLRRAQGPDGALSACRAAYIGGADSTSDVLGAALLGIPARGTHAHSWIQSFDSELEAFRAYARSFPDACILLVDTYDTLESGMPHAIRVAKELEREGHRLAGIRIDSGDLALLSLQARRMLDRESLGYVKIVASNDLDEFAIADVLARGGRVDIWGVGTNLITASGPGGTALGGIYKMVEHNGRPKIKLSADPGKTTNPGLKKIVRFYHTDGRMEADALRDVSEDLSAGEVLLVDPDNPRQRKKLDSPRREELLHPIVESGEIVYAFPSLDQIREHRREQMSLLHESHRRIHNPHEYTVGLTEKLWRQKERMLNQKTVTKEARSQE
ncbi:MAG: nicotinate phosphoribosyltransferase [Acidobacteria bacterium]|nr:nicotinate phosphoribosyltransferase [Acidobacteriota bacterium]